MRQLRTDRFTALLAAIGALGGALVLLRQVTYGVYLSTDSRFYIEAARNLLDGNGLVHWHGHLLVDAPPFFPFVLAGVGLFGLDAIEAAGYVNAAAFGLTVFATALWLRSHRASRFLVVWAACACALCVSLAHLSAWALTEPLFISFATLSLFTLDRFLDTRRRSLLLAAAMSAALAWLTRYVGVTLVASALLLLALHRGVPLSARIRSAIIYAVIAGTPMCLWMLRNFLHTGAPLGKVYPTGFSLLSSLNTAGGEFRRWLFGGDIFYAWGERLANLFSMGGDPMTAAIVNIGALLAAAAGIGYALVRLRRQGYARNLDMLVVPVAFISIYALFLAIQLPLADVNLPNRYIMPIYPPALFTATLLLNEFLRFATNSQPPIKPAFLRRWNAGETAMTRPALILMTCLSLWLIPQLYANYSGVKTSIDHGLGNTSKRWTDSRTVDYVRHHLHDGPVFSNRSNTLYFLTELGDRLRGLTRAQPRLGNVSHWIGYGTDWVNAYFVWFHEGESSHYEYGPAELAASVPGMEVEAILEDGIIFKSGKDSGGGVGPLDGEAILQAALKNARLIARSDFDVYQDKNENRLIYVREQCANVDTDPRFFLHVFPVDVAHLPDRRRQYGFDSTSFSFSRHVLRLDGLCVAVRSLPDYPISRIRTGQFIQGHGRLWTSEFNLD